MRVQFINLIFSRTVSSVCKQVRVRFAPSPTGSLHLGGLRSALYNYIFARKNNGRFILRIEDTDQTRVVPSSAVEIEELLRWAKLDPDESPTCGGNYGPYTQSERLELYNHYAEKLLETGQAYKCFCSQTRLELLRKHQAKNRLRLRYDGQCRHLTKCEIDQKIAENNGKYVIRFALDSSSVEFEDMVFGPLKTDLSEAQESDPIILKSDKYPTYHFANVVDDHSMDITHVLRGSEWISSTAKHIKLYEAFGWRLPVFAHFPLIAMTDGTKMSKRNNQSQVKTWIESGYRPLAVLNFLTNMGGGVPKEKQDSCELWDLDMLVDKFDFQKVSRHPGSVDVNKLRIYNSKDLNREWKASPRTILEEIKESLALVGIKTDMTDVELEETVKPLMERISTLRELVTEENAYIWKKPQLTWSTQEYVDAGFLLEELLVDVLSIAEENLDFSDTEKLLLQLKSVASKHEVDYSKFMRLLRRVLTNRDTGLPIVEIASQLGRSRLIAYLKNGIEYVS